MAQNIYIRPLAKNYHDFTEKKMEESNQQTPYKFKSKNFEQYMKKPIRPPRPVIKPEVPQQPEVEQQSCCSWLACCCKKNSNPVENREPEPGCCAPSKKQTSGHQSCCYGCLEPELCENCTQKICNACLEKMCLKFTLCGVCTKKLCSKCRKLVSGKCCGEALQLRNYPIRLKNKSNLHFLDCKCQDCAKFSLEYKQNTSPDRITHNNQLKTEENSQHFHAQFVDSVVHH